MPWPVADTSLLVHETETLVVQVNGKVRDRIEVPADADEAMCVALAAGLRARPGAPRRAEPKKVIARPPQDREPGAVNLMR